MENFRIKKVSAMEKVFSDREPSEAGMQELLQAFRKETVSFQIAYFWGDLGRGFVQAEVVSPLKEAITVRMVELVPCAYPAHPRHDGDYLTVKPGLYPDLLTKIPMHGAPLISGQWRSLWVDIESECAGIYPVEVVLRKDGKELGRCSVIVEIMEEELPPLQIPHTEWLHSDCLADYYQVEVFSEEYWRITENFVRTAARRNCNMLLTPVFTPPLDTAVGGERRTVQLVDVTQEQGRYSFGFEKFRRWIEMARKCGIRYFEISHLYSQWGATKAPKVMGNKDGIYQQLFGWDTDACSARYRAFLHQFLTALKEEARALGILEQMYFHISDEPQLCQLESYRAAREQIAKDLEGCQIIDALSDYHFYEQGLIRQPVCALDHIDAFLEKRPEKLWGYYCTSQCVDVSNRFIVMPGYRTRILGVQMYKFDLAGFLHWGYNFYNSQYSLYPIDPYHSTDADGAFPSGDPFLVYPGKDGKALESVRMMLIDEAMNDLRAMRYLESKKGRKAVMNCLEWGEYEAVNFRTYPRSADYLSEMRRRVNEAVKEA